MFYKSSSDEAFQIVRGKIQTEHTRTHNGPVDTSRSGTDADAGAGTGTGTDTDTGRHIHKHRRKHRQAQAVTGRHRQAHAGIPACAPK